MAGEERLVVKPYNPRRERQKLLLAAGAVIVSLFIGLLLGGQWFGWQMSAKRQLEADYADLQQQNQQLSQQLTTAQLNSEVDGNALEVVRSELSKLQGTLADTEEELSFYRNLLQQEGVAQGLSISGLSLTAGDEGNYNYQLVVQQRAGKLKTIKVTTKVEVEGVLDGEAKTLKLNEFDPEQDKDYMYLKFRYFYVHDGGLVLPEGFEPGKVTVRVWPAGQSKKQIKRQFDWHVETERSER